MADPATIIGGLKVASEARRAMDFLGEDILGRPHFGFSTQEAESSCRSLSVFLTAVGVTSTTRHRLQLAPSVSALGAREALGREMGSPIEQEEVQDEHGFTLSREMLQAPMTALSAGCRLHLRFVHRGNVVERSGSSVMGGLRRGMGTIFTPASETDSGG